MGRAGSWRCAVAKRIILCLSHAIEEFDQLRLLSSLGYEVASIGGYIDPSHPHDPKRPALPNVAMVQVVKDAVDALGTEDNLGTAQSRIPDAILDWLGNDGIIIFHHYLDRLFGDWPRIKEWMRGGGRVIWRSVGQSVEHNERIAAPYRKAGLERVAYSPKEANIPSYCGHDALIRFYKDPDEWDGWTGAEPVVINVTQHLQARHPYTNYAFWDEATRGLTRMALGPGSETHGGTGSLSEDEMKGWLKKARAYLYTGTQPASYTLGLIEAMMTGIPVISIGPSHMRVFPYGPDLFEGHEIAISYADDPARARDMLMHLLENRGLAHEASRRTRERALQLFGKETIAKQWREYLG